MKFDVKTIEILKNFSVINTSILFKPGNVISTVSPLKNFLARATVDITIPKEFAIYELTKFLGIISIMPDADIEFGDKQLNIKNDKSTLRYTYASPSMITASPYTQLTIEDKLAQFELPYSTLSTIVKAANILELPSIGISSEDGVITVKAFNSEDETSNTYRVDVGSTSNTFNVMFDVDRLKLLNRDYTVSVSDGGFVQFSASDIDYWVAVTSS